VPASGNGAKSLIIAGFSEVFRQAAAAIYSPEVWPGKQALGALPTGVRPEMGNSW